MNIDNLMENLEILPEGWSRVSLREVVSKLVDGSHNPPPKQISGRPMLSARNIDKNQILFDDFRYIAGVDFEREHARTRIAAGDVLLTIVGTIGRTAVVPSGLDGFTLQRSVALLTPEGVLPKFLMYQLESPLTQKYFEENARGTAQKGVYLKTLGQTPIKVAPLAQQTRIVAEIEKQFSRLDEALVNLKRVKANLKRVKANLNCVKANLKRVKANLKRYKAAVLKAAVEGRFTEGTWKPVANVIASIDQGWSPQCERESSGSEDIWGVIKTTAVQPMCFQQEENKILPDSLEPRSALEIIQGDLLITRAGPKVRVGISCLVRKTRPKLILCDKVYRLRCNKNVVAPEYLELVLNAPQILHVIDEIKTGISDSGVNLTQGRFLALDIPLPPIKIQERIVEETERKISILSGMEREFDTNLRRADRLRQSILKQAFSGQLVPHDPNDEPASVLLERIRKGVGAIHESPARATRKQNRAIHESPLRKPRPQTEPAPAVSDKFACFDDVTAAILAHMQPGRDYARADLADPLGLSTGRWNAAIQELKRVGKVRQVGEKRGARYRLVNSEGGGL